MRTSQLFLGVVLALGSIACNTESERRQRNVEAARALTLEYQAALKKELQAAMGEGGPAAAVSACRTAAPRIGARLASADAGRGWTVGRTSRRVRNPKNAATEWQNQGLREMERRLASKEPPEHIAWYDESGGRFLYMSPIMMGDVCVTCHGQSDRIPENVKSRLKELYPEDRATGFVVGESRGAFVVTGPLGR